MKTKTTLLFFALISSFSFAQEVSPIKEKTNYANGIHPVTREKLLEAKNIEDILDGFPKNEFEIVSYKLTVVPKGNDICEFSSENNLLSNVMKEKIKSLPGGSKIFVEYIKGKLKDRKEPVTRAFPAASFVLTEK